MCLRGLLTSLLLFVLSCGGGVSVNGLTVGGPCADSGECAPDSICLTGGDFPGGTCSLRCNDHADCPEGSRCVDKEGGVCLLSCEVPNDCRGGYDCKGRKSESNEGGESLVCIE